MAAESLSKKIGYVHLPQVNFGAERGAAKQTETPCGAVKPYTHIVERA